MKLKHSKQREFRFGEHARVWASLPADVRRHVIEVVCELLRVKFHRRREVKRGEQRQDHA